MSLIILCEEATTWADVGLVGVIFLGFSLLIGVFCWALMRNYD